MGQRRSSAILHLDDISPQGRIKGSSSFLTCICLARRCACELFHSPPSRALTICPRETQTRGASAMRTYSVEVESRQRTKRKGFFIRLLEALHRSRRREAIRVLRRYRHLVAGQAQIRPVKHVPKSRQTEKSSRN